MIPRIKIEGKSGCPIVVKENGSRLSLRKYASGEAYNQRLHEQEKKQAAFTGGDVFFAPAVLGQGTENNIYWFEMEYINGIKYSSYFPVISKQDIDEMIGHFISYFTGRIAEAEIKEAPVEVIQKKIDSMEVLFRQKAISTDLAEKTLNYLRNIPNHQLYIGNCHGDFTLSNMLFLTPSRICVFDLLDSFIETPLMDWVKLKQDTIFNWSIHVENQVESNTRLLQVLTYMDEKLSEHFKTDKLVSAWEKYLLVFNFARIIPYATSERDLIYLTHNINALIQ